MYTATIHFETYLGVDEIHVEAETIEDLRQIAEAETTKRKAETFWSSNVRKDGERI